MLRNIVVLAFVGIGAIYAVQAPLYALVFYIGNAYFRPAEWVWDGFVGSLHLSLVSGVYVILASLFSGPKLVWDRRIALLAVFLCQTFLSTLSSEHWAYSWSSWLEFLKVIVITYLIVVLVTDVDKFRLVLTVMVLALGLEQARQGWAYLIVRPGWFNANSVSFLGDNNGVAVGMLMLVPLIGLLIHTAKSKWTKYFYCLLFIGCLYRALSTYSRGGFVACVAMSAAWWLRSHQKLRGLIIMLFVAIILIPVLPDAFWNRMHTIKTYQEEEDPSALGRLHFWEIAIEMANANPFVGVGFNGYNPTYDAYDSSGGQYGRGRSAHSSFLGVLAELGYPGLILYILIMFGALRTCSVIHKRTGEQADLSELKKSALALEATLVAFVVGGSFVPFQYNEMLWHIVGLTIALERIATRCSGQSDLSDLPEPVRFTQMRAQVPA
jgi:probable O-glycosylation ligase (exosortase A-associated)